MMIEPSLRAIICGATRLISQWLEMMLLLSVLRELFVGDAC